MRKSKEIGSTPQFLMDQIYSEKALTDIPWYDEMIPLPLQHLLNSGDIQPCRAVDLGCGAGQHTRSLARLGFDITGIDLSPEAIRLARKGAKKEDLSIQFVAKDLSKPVSELKPFDFALGWEVLHHIFPEDRNVYLSNIHQMLKNDGKFLSVSFNEENEHFGSGQIRKTPLGTVLYFSSLKELTDLFISRFHIIRAAVIDVPGKRGPHRANYIFCEKRSGVT